VNARCGNVVGMESKDGALCSVIIDMDGESCRITCTIPITGIPDRRFLRWFVLPLVLDYATTVHSVQGCTIKSKVIIDMSNVFDFGMGKCRD
jgi:ATP-dependent exoDNAse (exonuclease V) alpha subunit